MNGNLEVSKKAFCLCQDSESMDEIGPIRSTVVEGAAGCRPVSSAKCLVRVRVGVVFNIAFCRTQHNHSSKKQCDSWISVFLYSYTMFPSQGICGNLPATLIAKFHD